MPTQMPFTPTRQAGQMRLAQFAPDAGALYGRTRNFDDGHETGGGGTSGGGTGEWRKNVSQLSPWLHAGLLDEAEVIRASLEHNSPDDAESFVSEVFWRVYFKGYLEQRPGVWASYCKGRDAAIAAARTNTGLAKAYAEASEGRTGIAAFDQWARELVQTGYLHNHARMWFASIWVFTLKLDWQLGADFFLRHLVDGDAASNTLSWRWVAGLHTKGKTYLARPDNIARYTERREGGPLEADGLATHAEPLEEQSEHARAMPELPTGEPGALGAQPYALLLHDEAASHVPLAFSTPPSLIIAASRPEARSPLELGEIAHTFATQAVTQGADAAAREFGCEVAQWDAGQPLAKILGESGPSGSGIKHLAAGYLPTGWTRDALWGELAPMEADGTLTQLVSDLDRAAWPHAKAGFFRVKKAIPGILGEMGITGG